MSIKRIIRRIGVTLAAAAAVAVPVVATTATQASASTIPYGNVQLCAQGSYPAFVHVLPVRLSNGFTTREYWSTVESPGHCWMSGVDTAGQWAQVDVVGIHSNGSEFYIGSRWYNSSVSGIGLGAEGNEWNPYIWQW
jgi:hypothetical protein